MVESLRLALAIAAKDLRVELRSRTSFLSAAMFAALLLVVFNFARDPTAVATIDLAPGILWVTVAFAAVVAMNRGFAVERENHAFDGLLLAPVSREALFLGKYLANLTFVLLVEAIALPLFVLFFNVDLSQALPRPAAYASPRHGGSGFGGYALQRHRGAYPFRRTDAPRAAAAVHGAAPRLRGADYHAAADRPCVERGGGRA